MADTYKIKKIENFVKLQNCKKKLDIFDSFTCSCYRNN